ncbi:hypothetical protein ACG3SL_14620 [Sphingomonas sp. CJ20]
MILSLAAGLLLGTTATLPPREIEHQVRLDHATGPVDARYRSRIAVSHRQIGSVAPAGQPSTLRCAWRADLHVDREALHPSGTTLQASLRRDAVAQGSRAGWCATQRAAIAEEVARRTEDVHGHLVDVAREDHGALTDTLDRMHRRTGG